MGAADSDPAGADRAQRHLLRRAKLRATLLLVAAGLVFVAASAADGTGFWLPLLRATAEAAVVGGLADWFAVTAIFRRPLGLPIPHTAVVATNKDRIGAGLGSFVAGNFLTPPLIAAKLRSLDPAGQLATWLAEEANAASAAAGLTEALPYLLRALEDREIRDFAARALGEQLRTADLSTLLGNALGLLTSGLPFDALLDRALDSLQSVLERQAGTISRIVEERSAWWVPKAVDRRIAGEIVAGIASLLAELRQPDGDRRRALRRSLEELARNLVYSPEQRARIEALKAQLLEQPEVKAWLAGIWDVLRRVVADDLADPQSRTREAVRRGLVSLGRTLAADPAMRVRLEAAIVEAAVGSAVPWRREIGRFIGEVVRGWETRTVVERLEFAVGADLQYVRISGTLVGACVGLALHLVQRLVG